MSADGDPAIHGELLALRIVAQRLLGQMAVLSGHDAGSVMRAEHHQASAELAMSNIIGADEAAVRAIRDHAQDLLDDIYAVAASTEKPNDPR